MSKDSSLLYEISAKILVQHLSADNSWNYNRAYSRGIGYISPKI